MAFAWEMRVDLPDDVVRLIFAYVREQRRDDWAATRIQAEFRRYRVETLVTRFRLLQYLWSFDKDDPLATHFLDRVTL